MSAEELISDVLAAVRGLMFKDGKNTEPPELCIAIEAAQKKGDEGEALQLCGEAVAAVLLTVMSAYPQKDKLDKALRKAKKLLPAFQGLDDRKGEADMLHLIAILNLAKQLTEPSMKAAKQAVEIYQELPNRHCEAIALRTVASCHLTKGSRGAVSGRVHTEDLPEAKLIELQKMQDDHTDEALRLTRETAAIFKELGEKRHEASAHRRIAELYLSKEDSDEAMMSAQKAGSIFQALGDPEAEVTCMHTSISALCMQEDGDEALRVAKKAVAVYRKSGDKKGEATALISVLKIYFMRAELDEVLSTAKEAERLYRLVDDRSGEVAVMRNVVNAHLAVQNMPEAQKVSRKMITVARESGKTYLEAIALHTMAQLLIDQYLTDLSKYDEMVDEWKAKGGPPPENLPEASIEEYEEAMELCGQAAEIYKSLKDFGSQQAVIETVQEAVNSVTMMMDPSETHHIVDGKEYKGSVDYWHMPKPEDEKAVDDDDDDDDDDDN